MVQHGDEVKGEVASDVSRDDVRETVERGGNVNGIGRRDVLELRSQPKFGSV